MADADEAGPSQARDDDSEVTVEDEGPSAADAQRHMSEAVQNQDIRSMFNDIVGDGVAPPHIAIGKYTKLREAAEFLTALLRNFVRSEFVGRRPELKINAAEVLVFCNRVAAELTKFMPPPPFSEAQVLQGAVSNAAAAQFSVTYKTAKEMECVRTFIKTCRLLTAHAAHLERGKSSLQFIAAMPGAEFYPFAFARLNVKAEYPSMSPAERTWMANMLSLILEHTTHIYEVYTTPDWDPDVFVQIMNDNIDKLMKQIPRCDQAFKMIRESLDMMRDNMGTYYRDFIATKNPSIMLENFILDVAKKKTDGRPNVRMMQQFRTIINKYKTLMANGVSDPRLKSVLDKVSAIGGIGGADGRAQTVTTNATDAAAI